MRPIDELLQEVRMIKMNLDRISKDFEFIKNKIEVREMKEREDRKKYELIDGGREIPRGWFF